MRTFTTRKGKALLLKLPVLLGCALATSVYAQNAEQIKAIQEQSNLKQLNVLKRTLTKKMPNERALRAKAKKMNIPFSGETNGRFFQLNGFDEETGEPIYYVTYNRGAAEGTQTNKLYSEFGVFDLSGENMKVYEWDGGRVLLSHQEFGGRVTQKDSPLKLSSHATHVAGTLIASGVNPNAKGMAYKAKLDAYYWDEDISEMTEVARQGGLLSNHSYGLLGGYEWGDWAGSYAWHWWGADEETEFSGYGQYSSIDRNWDMLTYLAPHYLPVKAAGNPRGEGPTPGGTHYTRVYNEDKQKIEWVVSNKVRQKNGGEDGYDCIIRGSVAKNSLIVGASKKLPNGYTSASDVEMASFSGYGPVDDGRIKPDITGVGFGIVSSVDAGNDRYDSYNGTSMASPNVTGSLLLLQELYSKKNNNAFMKSSTLKALVTGTANEAYSEGPDYASGWGLLNAYKAASSIELNGIYTLVEGRNLKNGETQEIEVTASGSEPLKVTIAWTDPASKTLSSGLNDRTKMLVNDLDVRVSDGSTEYLAWVLDPENPSKPATKGDNDRDNVEQVVVKNPVAGQKYTIRISHKGQLKKGAIENSQYVIKDGESQEYGLVVTGIDNGVANDLALKSLSIEVDPKDYNASTPVKFTVENLGSEDVADAKLRYTLTNKDDDTQVSQEEIDLGAIASGQTKDEIVNLDLSKSFVNYEIKGEVVFGDDEITINNKAFIKAYSTVVDLTAPKSSHTFGFEAPFDENGWTTEDVNKDGKTWFKYNDASFAHSGESFAISFPNQQAADDWLFSNPVRLKGGKTYVVIFYTQKFQTPREKISLGYGTDASSSAMTMIPNSEVEVGFNYKKYIFEFSVPTDQVGHIGFYNKSNYSYAVALDDVTIAMAEGAPVVDFSADKLNANAYEDVKLTSDVFTISTQPVTSYEWSFTPNTVTYINGTKNSKDVTVRFNEEGKYTVALKATNVAGEGVKSKESYITIANEGVKADFEVSAKKAYTKERVFLKSTSTGKPAPQDFEWTISPNANVEFLEGTTKASENVIVQFNEPGEYTVKLKATSPYNSDEKEMVNVITVTDRHTPVKDLEASFDKPTTDLKLTWEKPTLVPMYYEEFDGSTIPVNMTIVDANRDGASWMNIENSAVSFSWEKTRGAFNASDWLITDKIKAGAEKLSYYVKTAYKERYDVYVVAARADGKVPSVNEIKTKGNKIHGFEAAFAITQGETKTFDIAQYTGSDFHVVFHHRTTKEDDGLYLQIDNLYVGYSDQIPEATQRPSQAKVGKKVAVAEDVLVKQQQREPADKVREFGATTSPVKLVGYEVVKGGTSVETKSDVEDRTYNEKMNTTTGKYVYDVYALYSDGVKSEKRTIEVDLSTLSVGEVQEQSGIKVYPNPSNGLFTVALGSNVSDFETMVYDLAGKLLFKESFQGNKAELNLTQYSKGVYVLNVVDNNGEQKTVKLVIK